MTQNASPIARHKTALRRSEASRPIRLAQAHGILRQTDSVFDYGCGHGGDVNHLTRNGFACTGWDPAYRPNAPKTDADVVNLGFVINVIEDPDERAAVARDAWSHTKRVLVISARLLAEARLDSAAAEPLQDGVLTRLGTFQKFYQQTELKDWIDATLTTNAVPAGPGVFYAFRDETERQSFIASRYRRTGAARIFNPTAVYQAHEEVLRPLLDFLASSGRLPTPDDGIDLGAALEACGSLSRIGRILTAVVDADQLAKVCSDRIDDLLVYLALGRFDKRPRWGNLPRPLQTDIRAFFAAYANACKKADDLLFSVGNREKLDEALRTSPIGKLTGNALYVHQSALDLLAPPLRVLEGCGRAIIGTVEAANIIKLHRDKPRVSYLAYPGFDKIAHPPLRSSLVVDLQTFRVDVRNYTDSPNPPILHRKEEFVAPAYPRHATFRRLTKAEENLGLFATPQSIGTAEGWAGTLAAAEVVIRGHRLLRQSEC